MPLEQVNYSQVISLAPAQPPWNAAITSGGQAAPGVAQFGPFGGYSYFTAGNANAIAAPPAQPGDKFRLWSSGGTSLKEATVFTVAGVLPTPARAWYVFFLPQPMVSPASGDSAVSLQFPKSGTWLGSLGHVTGLVRSYTVPGGPDQLSCTLRVPADYRTPALDPGRVIQAWRGASCIWEGKLNEPVPGSDGWGLTAHGAGTYGSDFAATYTAWNSDDPVNKAIGRGLRWVNPGIGNPPLIWNSQQQDSGANSVTAHLNLLISGGGLLWQVTPGIASTVPAGPWRLSVYPFPSDALGRPLKAPDRLLTCTTPVPRTVASDVNTLVLRYQVSNDVPATSHSAPVPAQFGTVSVVNAGSLARHGPMEYFIDLSSAGLLTAAQATTAGQQILSRFVRAAFAGSFTAAPGQVRNAAGQAVDLGTDQAGLVYQVIMTDAPYGGEVTAPPLTFLSGAYSYDEDSQTATITPYQGVRTDISSLLGALFPSQTYNA